MFHGRSGLFGGIRVSYSMAGGSRRKQRCQSCRIVLHEVAICMLLCWNYEDTLGSAIWWVRNFALRRCARLDQPSCQLSHKQIIIEPNFSLILRDFFFCIVLSIFFFFILHFLTEKEHAMKRRDKHSFQNKLYI